MSRRAACCSTDSGLRVPHVSPRPRRSLREAPALGEKRPRLVQVLTEKIGCVALAAKVPRRTSLTGYSPGVGIRTLHEDRANLFVDFLSIPNARMGFRPMTRPTIRQLRPQATDNGQKTLSKVPSHLSRHSLARGFAYAVIRTVNYQSAEESTGV